MRAPAPSLAGSAGCPRVHLLSTSKQYIGVCGRSQRCLSTTGTVVSTGCWVTFGQCVVHSCYRLLLSHLLPRTPKSCTLGPGRASNDGRTCYVCRPLITPPSRNRISA